MTMATTPRERTVSSVSIRGKLRRGTRQEMGAKERISQKSQATPIEGIKTKVGK